jgi:hypothetical protein
MGGSAWELVPTNVFTRNTSVKRRCGAASISVR